MTADLLRYSRIEKALVVIAAGGGAWPADASLMAEALLVSWEERVGALKNVRADLWGVGGRLEGCRRVGGRRGEEMKVCFSYSFGFGDVGEGKGADG